jgi:replicative DNA helicase
MTAQPMTNDPLLVANDPTARAHEMAAIGCCMFDSLDDVRGMVLERLADTDLVDRQCRVSLKLIRQLVADGERVDVVTLELAAERAGVTLRDEFLTDLAVDFPDPWRAEKYIQAIKDARLCRELLSGARRVASLAAAGDVEALTAAREVVSAADEDIQPTDVAKLAVHVGAVLQSLDRPMGSAMGISTGLPRLDQLTLGLQPGQFIVIAGRPGMGKSALALGFAREAAFRSRKGVAYFSLEMSATEQARRILAAESGIEHKLIRGNYLNGPQRDLLRITARSIEGWDLFIDDAGRLDVDEMERRMHSLHRVYGLSMVIVDYLQLVDVERGRSREQEVAKLSRTCKAMARSLNLPVVALCQLSRECEKRPDKRPMLHDLRESGSLEQDCDLALLLYREGYYNAEADQETAEIIVAKQRDGETDIVQARFDGKRMRFLP